VAGHTARLGGKATAFFLAGRRRFFFLRLFVLDLLLFPSFFPDGLLLVPSFFPDFILLPFPKEAGMKSFPSA
jgi:hypothetical protein